MATVTQGSFELCTDIKGTSIPLYLWKTTVTVATGATTASIQSSNKVAGTVVAVWLDPGTLTASATIKGYSQDDDLTTPAYWINYTVPNPAVETRAALNARTLCYGRQQIDIASATAADSVTIYVWVNPEAEPELASVDVGDVTLLAGTALVGKVGIDQTTPGTTNKVSIGADGTVTLLASTAAIGKLAANNGVDIGDVDVTSTANPTGLATVATGERAGSVTAVQLATVAAKFVRLKAHTTNAGSIYVGGSNAVTVAAGTTTTTSGFQLASGDDSGWLPASNLNLFWIICENAGDDLTYMVMV